MPKQARTTWHPICACTLGLLIGFGTVGQYPSETNTNGGPTPEAPIPFTPRARDPLIGGARPINDKATDRSTRAEGLLTSSRMVSSVFDDCREVLISRPPSESSAAKDYFPPPESKGGWRKLNEAD